MTLWISPIPPVHIFAQLIDVPAKGLEPPDCLIRWNRTHPAEAI